VTGPAQVSDKHCGLDAQRAVMLAAVADTCNAQYNAYHVNNLRSVSGFLNVTGWLSLLLLSFAVLVTVVGVISTFRNHQVGVKVFYGFSAFFIVFNLVLSSLNASQAASVCWYVWENAVDRAGFGGAASDFVRDCQNYAFFTSAASLCFSLIIRFYFVWSVYFFNGRPKPNSFPAFLHSDDL